MRNKDLQNERLDEVGQNLLEASRPGKDAIENIVASPRKITANACLDVLRNQKRKPEDLTCELSETENEALMARAAPPGLDSETRLVRRDLAEKLLSRLGGEDRAVLHMLHAEGMNIAEIAEAMNWSSSKVKLRAWRARNMLRKILKKYL